MSLLYGLMNLLAALCHEFHVRQRVNRSDSRVADALSRSSFRHVSLFGWKVTCICRHIKELQRELRSGSDISYTPIEYLLRHDHVELGSRAWEH
jgi:hypothetical protein